MMAASRCGYLSVCHPVGWRLLLSTILAATLTIQWSYAGDLFVEDPGLQNCLLNQAKKHNWTTPEQVTQLSCHSKGVSTLKGLQAFTNLQTLSLYNNDLSQLDIELAAFTRLQSLNLARNQLRQLTLIELEQLSKLYLFDNGMKHLKLANLPRLSILKANNNRLQTFTYQGTSQLKKIYIFNNKLETIDIHNLPQLQYMDCRQNPMPDALYDEMDKMEEITFLHDGNAEDW